MSTEPFGTARTENGDRGFKQNRKKLILPSSKNTQNYKGQVTIRPQNPDEVLLYGMLPQ
jgi:hypothetical protein